MAPSQFGGALLLLTIPFPLSIPPWPPRITWVATFCATIQPVGCRSRARLDQGRTVDLALHLLTGATFLLPSHYPGGSFFPISVPHIWRSHLREYLRGRHCCGCSSSLRSLTPYHMSSSGSSIVGASVKITGGEDLHGIGAGGCNQSLSSGCSSIMSLGSPTRRFLDITCSDSAL